MLCFDFPFVLAKLNNHNQLKHNKKSYVITNVCNVCYGDYTLAYVVTITYY